jgi:phage FluMu protein Com
MTQQDVAAGPEIRCPRCAEWAPLECAAQVGEALQLLCPRCQVFVRLDFAEET